MDNFFNTIHLTGEELLAARAKCGLQEQRILDIFDITDVARDSMTPFEVQSLYESRYGKVPITSIRRAMTCLTSKGLLRKSSAMKVGGYGMLNHTWEAV